MKIAIAMATFNPNPEFLRQQIQSIMGQSFKKWICYISDESTDEVLANYLAKLIEKDNRFILLRSDQKRRGAFYNFERALMAISGRPDYIAFCDQDDIWDQKKLETMSEYLDENPEVQLVHSDLRLINESNDLITDSCWKFEFRLIESSIKISDLLVRNQVTGCATLFRSSLLKVALPFPSEVQSEYLHDHWMALIARTSGPLGIIRTPLTEYRQHSGNVIGAQHFSGRTILKKLITLSQLSQKGREALRIRQKLVLDFRTRIESTGKYISKNIDLSAKDFDLILGGNCNYFFSYFLKSTGKKYQMALGFQLYIGSLFK